MMINRPSLHHSDKFCFSLAIFNKKAIFDLKTTIQG